MQIHDLNTKSLTDPAYVAFDDGTDTYKTEFNDVVADAAADAVASADLTDNTVAFTSGDSTSPTGWTAVDVLTSGLSLKTLFNRISTMVKNVRYIWNLLGSSSFSNVASTLTGAIGNTALTTTAQTLSGAIAEHESDISTLNSKFSQTRIQPSIYNNRCTELSGGYIIIGNIVIVTLQFSAVASFSGSQAYLSGLPVPITSRGTLSVYGQASTTPHIQAHITDGGNLTLSGNITNNETISIAGAYIRSNT